MDGLETFLEELASGAPVPGGGAVAALQIAMAAALLSMVCNLTVGRKKYVSVADSVHQVRDRALQTMNRAHQLADEDAEAYGRVAAAMMLPRMSEEQRATRTEALQVALKEAVTPPLETMRLAVRVLSLANDLVEIGNRSAVSDVGVAAAAARAGFRAARLNVEINLALVRDTDWVERVRTEMDPEQSVGSAESRVLERVERLIHGDGG